MVELPDHPYFVGCQFHPELKSRPMNPHPLFVRFVRASLERALGKPCRSIAAPFGEGDERFVRIARQCGYASGFTTDPGHAALGHDPLRLPRIEVLGGWSIEAFIEAVQGV